ncbi:hypothetical protein [Agrobacterium tumefaciens]|uniref:hypothetical protein n=1 Tax=Agrobacterium tumefaciens TaxID=358 RepID=UPI001571B681|nr:hypothetical protein [Agrobacterium tumefaciens]
MTHYFDGLKSKLFIAAALKEAAARLDGEPDLADIADVIAVMDTAELRLIGCGVPPTRKDGAIASLTIPVRAEDGTEIAGQGVFVIVRRFPDDPAVDVAGNNWRLIEASPTTTAGAFGDDPADSLVVIGLPPEDLKALRAGGDNLSGFDIYVEKITTAKDGERYRINSAAPPFFPHCRPTPDYIDAWEPTGAQIEAVRIATTAREAWLAVW